MAQIMMYRVRFSEKNLKDLEARVSAVNTMKKISRNGKRKLFLPMRKYIHRGYLLV